MQAASRSVLAPLSQLYSANGITSYAVPAQLMDGHQVNTSASSSTPNFLDRMHSACQTKQARNGLSQQQLADVQQLFEDLRIVRVGFQSFFNYIKAELDGAVAFKAKDPLDLQAACFQVNTSDATAGSRSATRLQPTNDSCELSGELRTSECKVTHQDLKSN